VIPANGNVKLVYTPASGKAEEFNIFDFKDGGGVVMGEIIFYLTPFINYVTLF
jgi:hypothetical protein